MATTLRDRFTRNVSFVSRQNAKLDIEYYCRMNIGRYEATEKIGHSLFKSDARLDFKHTIVEIT